MLFYAIACGRLALKMFLAKDLRHACLRIAETSTLEIDMPTFQLVLNKRRCTFPTLASTLAHLLLWLRQCWLHAVLPVCKLFFTQHLKPLFTLKHGPNIKISVEGAGKCFLSRSVVGTWILTS